MDPAFESWVAALERRHLANLRFADLRRAVSALSALYVGRRSRLADGGALDGAGKRAAFALFYGPLHFLVVASVLRSLGAERFSVSRVLDLGCGTGVAGAAWALESGPGCRVVGWDRNRWALDEARWTYRALGVSGRGRPGEIARLSPRCGAGDGLVAAFVINELDAPGRAILLRRLLDAAGRGARVLVVEPVARAVAPWWREWSAAFAAAGGRDDEWRFHAQLPDLLVRLDRAAGLDHRRLTARTLWLHH